MLLPQYSFRRSRYFDQSLISEVARIHDPTQRIGEDVGIVAVVVPTYKLFKVPERLEKGRCMSIKVRFLGDKRSRAN